MNVYAITLVALLALLCAPAPVRAEGPIAESPIAETALTVSLTIGEEVVRIDLLDNPAAKAFAAQLPLTLAFTDYAGAEKIATLPQRLSPQASPSGREIPVDFAYFVPWGNLAIYYTGVGDDGQILALGRIRTGKAILAKQGANFTATLELLKP